MKKRLNLLVNTFERLAKKSHKRFYKFMFLFMQALYAQNTVPDIGDLYTEMLPFYKAFADEYVKSKYKTGVRMGDTYAQKQFFKKLTKNMKTWHRNITLIFDTDTVEYKKIFPFGLTPLGSGAMDERLTYFKAIIKSMEDYASLNTIRTDMETFRDSLQNIRITRAQSGTGVKVSSADLKQFAKDLAVEMYGAMGMLMYIFKKNPDKILEFISVDLLRYQQKPANQPDDIYELILAGGETKEAGFVFTIDEKLLVYNSGDTVLRFWFVKAVDDPMPATYFDLQPDEVKEFFINVYANTDDRFMMVKNLHDAEEGSVEIEKL